MSKKLTPNLLNKVIADIEDEMAEFVIYSTPESFTMDEDSVRFMVKTKPDFNEMRLIVNKTVQFVIELSKVELTTEVKRIIFYTLLLEVLSPDFPVPKQKSGDNEMYDFEQMQLILNRIGFDRQLRSVTGDRLMQDLLFSVQEMEKSINEKLDFFKQQKISNSELFKNVNDVIASFKEIPGIIEKFSSILEDVGAEDVQALVSAFTELNKDGNLSENVVNAFLKRKQDDVDEALLESARKEFQNVTE